ncbi:MAG: beta-lactamase family protein [Myxococcales bacterium]|jgi:CubicO group peptidase (beta-lactamase class C family)|nr:beta-lactamase family protein [Myxococcales bacterium]
MNLTSLLRQGLDQGVFPGASATVFHGERCVHEDACGVRWLDGPPVDVTTRFDLASLTKILATLPALLRLADLRELSIDDRVTRFWPAFGARGKADLTLRMLLTHASGLPAWKPLFLESVAPLTSVERSEVDRPPWTEATYSDLGFIALGSVVERVTGMRLDDFVREEVHVRLGLEDQMGFRPIGVESTADLNIAATGLWRPREPAAGQEGLVPAPPPNVELPAPRPGEVDDDNALAMGGVSGHAGLFGTARGVGLFGARVFEELEGARRLASVELWREACRRDARTPNSTRALGFDTPSAEGSSAGPSIAASRAVGHLGFTGTSLWIDLDRQLAIALLTNRVHPTRGNDAIKAFRPQFCEAALQEFVP